MRIVFIGLTLFALFFGAGNLIFPVQLGQLSGNNFQMASFGFSITGVMMPLLGVIAMGFSGEKDFLKITQRCGVIFGFIFAIALYLTIGPLFAIPRTGSVSYEIAVKPFINLEYDFIYSALFSILFFGFSCLSSINPSKLIDIVGKYLTPVLILFIFILITATFLSPISEIISPQENSYINIPFFTGFSEGYKTMDTLASFIFGIIVIQEVTSTGVQDKKKIISSCIKASFIAAGILIFFYISLSYMGAVSVKAFGVLSNGGETLAKISTHYFGSSGNIVLGIIVTFACLTTNIGLTIACAKFISSIFPKISYKVYVIFFSVFSGFVANVGLSNLISFSKPVLEILYPVTIVLIFLTFTNRFFKGSIYVYNGTIYTTLFVSVISVLYGYVSKNESSFASIIQGTNNLFTSYLPLYGEGVGWLIPAIIVGALGCGYDKLLEKNN